MKTNLIGISGKIGFGKDTVGEIIRFLWDIENTEDGQHLEVEDFIAEPSDVDSSNPYQIKKFADEIKDTVCRWIGCTREQLEDRDFKEKELGEEWDKTLWYIQSNHNKLATYLSKEEAEADLSHYDENYNQEVYIACEDITMTPRILLQLLGTECGRQIIHPNIWVNALFADYKGKYLGATDDMKEPVEMCFPNWIITDVRFPNEAKAIKDRGGIVIRVERNKNKHFISEGTKPKGLVEVIRKLDNGEEIEWTCFWDYNGWYDSSGVNIPNVLKWEDKIVEHPSETALDNHNFDYVIDNNGSIEELIEKVKSLNLV
jgi:hypothetical protein